MYKIISTFTGAGDLDIGFHGEFSLFGEAYPRLKFETKASIDINEDAVRTVTNNPKYFRSNTAFHADIFTFDKERCPDHDYDVLLGGFPCVTFSFSGKRLGVTDNAN